MSDELKKIMTPAEVTRLFLILCTIQADLGVEAASATYYAIIVPPNSFAPEEILRGSLSGVSARRKK